MKEELLQFIWAHGLFNRTNLQTADGLPVQIDSLGTINHVAGPDFSESKVRLGETIWAGNVEIHVLASEWRYHNHQFDPAYNSVILHVVYENDEQALNQKGDAIPTLELKGRIPRHTLLSYEKLKASKEKIPCSNHFADFPQIKFSGWLQRLLIARLERKTSDIELLWKLNGHDWLQTFYALFCSYLGQNHNKLPFQELARVLPYQIIAKHINDRSQIECLLFGVAGLLNEELEGAKYKSLQRDFHFLSAKYNLKPISQQWKLGGIRPEAFPFRRLALLSAIVPKTQEIFKSLMTREIVELTALPLAEMEFWNNRYSFKEKSISAKPIKLTNGISQLLNINVFAPFLFFYGKQSGSDLFIEYAIRLLENQDAESNSMVRSWVKLGFEPKSAADSQSLIELTSQYCDHKKCVICNVGKSIILTK